MAMSHTTGGEKWGVQEFYQVPLSSVLDDVKSHFRLFPIDRDREECRFDAADTCIRILEMASAAQVPVLTTPFVDFSRAGVLVLFNPADELRVVAIATELRLQAAKVNFPTVAKDFLNAVRFSMSTAVALGQEFYSVGDDTFFCRGVEFDTARDPTSDVRGVKVPSARWNLQIEHELLTVKLQCANYNIIPLRLQHLAPSGTDHLEVGRTYKAIDDEKVLLLPGLAATFYVLEYTIVDDPSSGGSSVSVTCTQGDASARVTAPLGSWVRTFEPFHRTADDAQQAISTEVRGQFQSAATKFLHLPALALPEQPMYDTVDSHSTPAVQSSHSVQSAFTGFSKASTASSPAHSDKVPPTAKSRPREFTTVRPIKERKSAKPAVPTTPPPLGEVAPLIPAPKLFKPTFGIKKEATKKKLGTKASKKASAAGSSPLTQELPPAPVVPNAPTAAAKTAHPEKKRKVLTFGPSLGAAAAGGGAVASGTAAAATATTGGAAAPVGPPKPKRPKKVHAEITNETIVALFKDKGEKEVAKLSLDPLKKWLKASPLPGGAKVTAWGKIKKAEVMAFVMQRLAELVA